MKQDPQGVLRGPSRPRRLATALSFAFSLGQWGLAHYAQAQTDPATQQYQREQERERALRRQQETTPDVRLPAESAAPAPPLPAQETPCYPIRRVELRGEE